MAAGSSVRRPWAARRSKSPAMRVWARSGRVRQFHRVTAKPCWAKMRAGWCPWCPRQPDHRPADVRLGHRGMPPLDGMVGSAAAGPGTWRGRGRSFSERLCQNSWRRRSRRPPPPGSPASGWSAAGGRPAPADSSSRYSMGDRPSTRQEASQAGVSADVGRLGHWSKVSRFLVVGLEKGQHLLGWTWSVRWARRGARREVPPGALPWPSNLAHVGVDGQFINPVSAWLRGIGLAEPPAWPAAGTSGRRTKLPALAPKRAMYLR